MPGSGAELRKSPRRLRRCVVASRVICIVIIVFPEPFRRAEPGRHLVPSRNCLECLRLPFFARVHRFGSTDRAPRRDYTKHYQRFAYSVSRPDGLAADNPRVTWSGRRRCQALRKRAWGPACQPEPQSPCPVRTCRAAGTRAARSAPQPLSPGIAPSRDFRKPIAPRYRWPDRHGIGLRIVVFPATAASSPYRKTDEAVDGFLAK